MDLDHPGEREGDGALGGDLVHGDRLAVQAQGELPERRLAAVDPHLGEAGDRGVREPVLQAEPNPAGGVLEAAQGIHLLEDQAGDLHGAVSLPWSAAVYRRAGGGATTARGGRGYTLSCSRQEPEDRRQYGFSKGAIETV